MRGAQLVTLDEAEGTEALYLDLESREDRNVSLRALANRLAAFR